MQKSQLLSQRIIGSDKIIAPLLIIMLVRRQIINVLRKLKIIITWEPIEIRIMHKITGRIKEIVLFK
jgi:hypothetical protein